MADSAVRESISIPAEPEAVWDVLMDPARLEDWVHAHSKLDDAPEHPLSVGDRYRQRLGIGPVGFWVEWELIEARKPELAVWRGSGPGNSTADITYRLTTEGDAPPSTRFDYENDFKPPAGRLGAAANRVVNAAARQREARRSMKRLRELF